MVLVGKCAAGMATMASKSRTRDAAEVLSRDEGYLAELLSFSLDRLSKEPELLKDDQVRIQRQLEETAFKNYKAFVATAECVEKVEQGLSDIGKELSSIHDRVPAIERDASAYENTLESHLREQTQNKLVVANASQVQEILEVKQLMETCIRHGSYDEALDLEAFVNKLTVLHPNVSIVRSLEKQSKDLSKRMQKQLFGRLRGNLQLPECLRIVGYLRRMGGFTENGLREEYLGCRDAWFQSLVDDLPRKDHYTFIKRVTDYHRVHLFDIIMQYRAIFSKEESRSKGDKYVYADLLHVWSAKRIENYLALLRGSLPSVREGANLSSVFEHCMYCGMSLGRIGLDFRGLLVPVFEDAVRGLFKGAIKRAVATFEVMLAGYKWPKTVAALPAATMGAGGNGSGSGAPPYEIMQHPPLAVLTNGFLASLNEVRHCAPKGLAEEISRTLDGALEDIGTTLKWYQPEASERETFGHFCAMYTNVAAPYILGQIAVIFPTL